MINDSEENIGPFIHAVDNISTDRGMDVLDQVMIASAAKSPRNAHGNVGILVSWDMHWLRRSGSGKKYVSPSGC